MENLRKQFISELRNLEIGEDELLTEKLVTQKFRKKALKVHSDKTGKSDDEEFKQLLNDYNAVKNAIKELSDETMEVESEKSDLQNFFDRHNFAKEFSQSWTIFVEKDRVQDWKKELLRRFPDQKELQGNGIQYRAPVDERIVSVTFYDVEIPKMNIQGPHSCIRKFVLNILPDIYKSIKVSIELGNSEPVNAVKNKPSGESSYKCDACNKCYVKKNGLDKHKKSKHAKILQTETVEEENEGNSDQLDRSNENCPTCDNPKGRGKHITCKKCKINFHGDCVAVEKQKLDDYKSGKLEFECEDCYLEILPKNDLKTSQGNSANSDEIIDVDEHCDTVYECDACDFVSDEKSDLQGHVKTTHEVMCLTCKTCFKSQLDLDNHKKVEHLTEESVEEETNVEEHLRNKCEYLEVEIDKERKVNAANLENITNQKKTIEDLKREIKKANDRTKEENSKVVEMSGELKVIKDKMNEEIIVNENNRRVIDELNKKLKAQEENAGQSKSSNLNDDSDEIRELKEKAKEFKATSDLKINKMKEKHLEELNEVKIKKIRVEEELRSTIKEKQRLKESERILVQTFDTLKTFYEKPSEQKGCDDCVFSCNTEAELNVHKQTEHTVRYACNSCSFETESKMEYDNHRKTHIPSTEKTKYVCEICSLEGYNKSVMEEHMEKTHTCRDCKTVYKDVYELNRHKEANHSKKFNCQECGYISKSEVENENHLAGHEEIGYSCEVCGKIENTETNLEDHMKSKHVKEMFHHFKTRNGNPGRRNTPRSAFNRERIMHSHQERKANGVCGFWNKGRCSYGEFCKFSHVESPSCWFDDKCNRKNSCRFSHTNVPASNQNRDFLGPRTGYQGRF